MKYSCENLKYEGRCLRTRSGKLLFGPAGRRLFIDYLDKVPGFCGRIDFIHKMNLPEIFHIDQRLAPCFDSARTTWYPSHLHMEYESELLEFSEDKFVTEDDIAVSCQRWVNRGSEELVLQLSAEPALCRIEKGEDEISVLTPVTPHGLRVFYLVRAEGISCLKPLSAAPGETVVFTVCAAFGNAESEQKESAANRLEKFFRDKAAGGLVDHSWQSLKRTYLERQIREYGEFYSSIPDFVCSDAMINRIWHYRWYILKNSYARPDYGNLRHGVMYEGRSHKMGKMPFQCDGWEFSRLIPLSTPLQIMDLKWRGDPKLAEEMIESLLDSQDEDGLFRVMSVDDFGPAYANFAIWAIYQFYLLNGRKKPDEELLSRLKRFVAAHDRIYGSEADGLQVERIHQRTGKEYQPSYWYFSGFPADYKNPETYTWLKRVDRSVYHYLNIKGLAGLCRLCKDPAAAQLDKKAEMLASRINEKMWDGNTHFYYDLHYLTDEKAFVKNIVGYYPFWAGIGTEGKEEAFQALCDEKQFGLEAGLPSVAADCPAYAPSGGWMGQYMKGRDGCVWCGPSWPYTSGIILDMLGKQSKEMNHRLDSLFKKQLHLYALQHFRDQDIDRPYLVEHYNPETGEPLSDEADYNHSFFIQLIMEHVLGISVSEIELVVDPVDIGLGFFKCGPVLVRGHELFVEYRKSEFFRIVLDGSKIAESDRLTRVAVQMIPLEE